MHEFMRLRSAVFREISIRLQAVNQKNNFKVVLGSLNGVNWRVHREEITL